MTSKEEKELISDSEYRTASEFQPEFQSDNEPPQDVLIEPKLVVKMKDVRVYKKILKIGRDSLMPSKYDEIVYKLKMTEEETLNPRELDEVEFQDGQMGFTITDRDIIFCLENMKAGEIASFRIEYVKFGEHKKRILDREVFLVAEMKSWQTIIDVHGEMNCFKRVFERGVGQKRYDIHDEITFQATIYQNKETPLLEYNLTNALLTSIDPPVPSTLIDMLKTSKAKEHFLITAHPSYHQQAETSESLRPLLSASEPLYLDIKVEAIREVMDLFNDGQVLKKVSKRSYTTSAPDDNSRIYFDYWVEDCQGRMMHQSTPTFLNLMPAHDDIPSMEERSCQRIFLDEYDLSRAFRKALRMGKKLEEFELLVKDLKYFKYGADFKKVKKIVGEQSMEAVFPLKFTVKVYFFSSGENYYTLGIPEKQQYCDLKKPKIAQLIKEGEYRKAQKLLLKVRDMCERVDKHEKKQEEIDKLKEEMASRRKSCLMNLTLCQWKLGQWGDLLTTSEIILKEIAPKNSKILYRRFLALLEKKDYHLLIEEHEALQKTSPPPEACPELEELYQKAKKLETQVKKREKAMFGGMLGALTDSK